jgi:hypothetical protein
VKSKSQHYNKYISPDGSPEPSKRQPYNKYISPDASPEPSKRQPYNKYISPDGSGEPSAQFSCVVECATRHEGLPRKTRRELSGFA